MVYVEHRLEDKLFKNYDASVKPNEYSNTLSIGE